jgi:hypothetical protein
MSKLKRAVNNELVDELDIRDIDIKNLWVELRRVHNRWVVTGQVKGISEYRSNKFRKLFRNFQQFVVLKWNS